MTSSPSANALMLCGTSAALPAGPSGRPMSLAVSTSPARPPRRGADLAAEHRAAGLAEHPDQRPGHRLGLLGHGVAHRADDVLGDRLDQHPPDVGRLLDPLRPAPGGGGAHPGGEHGRVVEPVVGEAHRVGDARSGRCGRGWGRAPARRCGGRCRSRGSSSPARRTAPSWPASDPSGRRDRASRRRRGHHPSRRGR